MDRKNLQSSNRFKGLPKSFSGYFDTCEPLHTAFIGLDDTLSLVFGLFLWVCMQRMEYQLHNKSSDISLELPDPQNDIFFIVRVNRIPYWRQIYNIFTMRPMAFVKSQKV